MQFLKKSTIVYVHVHASLLPKACRVLEARSIRSSYVEFWEQLRYFCIFRETEIIQVRRRKWCSRLSSGETFLNRDQFHAKSFDNGKNLGITERCSREFEKLGRHYGEDTALVSGRYLSCLNILRDLREKDRFFSENRVSTEKIGGTEILRDFLYLEKSGNFMEFYWDSGN